LDLHANPEVTGTRFENPKWWHHLPSLKPVGLNAMLTYALSSFEHEWKHAVLPTASLGQGVRESGVWTGGEEKEGGATITATSRQVIESALVQHVKRGLPLECLR
jgi:hypothetical protein